MIPARHWKWYDWESIGFGIGFEPFKWRRFGIVSYDDNGRWFNIGPLFIQWSFPRKW